MSNLTLPEAFKIVQGHEPATATALAATSDVISCKNLKKLWVVVTMAYVNNVDVVITWNESSDVAGTGDVAITETCPIWGNIDTATADLLARKTDAITFTMDTSAGKNQLWIMEWDPAKFSAGFDCFKLVITSAGTSIVAVNYIAEPRYQSDVVPTAITD